MLVNTNHIPMVRTDEHGNDITKIQQCMTFTSSLEAIHFIKDVETNKKKGVHVVKKNGCWKILECLQTKNNRVCSWYCSIVKQQDRKNPNKRGRLPGY
jgi:hypothetical protein